MWPRDLLSRLRLSRLRLPEPESEPGAFESSLTPPRERTGLLMLTFRTHQIIALMNSLALRSSVGSRHFASPLRCAVSLHHFAQPHRLVSPLHFTTSLRHFDSSLRFAVSVYRVASLRQVADSLRRSTLLPRAAASLRRSASPRRFVVSGCHFVLPRFDWPLRHSTKLRNVILDMCDFRHGYLHEALATD